MIIMALYVNSYVSNLPSTSQGVTLEEINFANKVALQAFNMNCNQVHIDSPNRFGEYIYTAGAGSTHPISVHFHGKKNNVQYKINNSTVTFIMKPYQKPKSRNTFTSYGIKFKA